MIAVIFEVTPKPGAASAYFDAAVGLRDALQAIDGFVSVERFESVTTPGKFLSLSFWRDEAAVQRWRTTQAHRDAQSLGRASVFADYRLRVAHVVRDYGLHERSEAPADSRTIHDPTQD